MKKQFVVMSALALALSLPIVGCSSDTSSTDTSDDTTTEEEATDDATEEEASTDEVDTSIYVGQWRGSVETSGTSVYGTTGGSEQMIDVYLEEDGTCYTSLLEAHADLLEDSGTWTTDGSTITLELSTVTIELTLVDDDECTADPTSFGIDGFDEITFVYYG